MGLRIDLIGRSFGKLKVIEVENIKTTASGKKNQYWKCECECGGFISLYTTVLTSGNTKSCGCIRDKKDVIGRKFGKLLVVENLGGKPDGDSTSVYCRAVCECGGEWIGRRYTLKRRICPVKSCGCIVGKVITHGYTGKREYNIYNKMMQRCYNPNSDKYHRYGGRGIIVCDRWKSEFINFLRDMGPIPSVKHSIDRRDVNGNYEPDNCKWATQKEQMNNTTVSKFIEFNGENMTISQWCDKFNKPYNLVRNRVRKGWSLENALFKIKGNQGNKCYR